MNKENIMHIKLLYNERERQTQRLTSTSVSTQTDPENFEDLDEGFFQDAVEGPYSFITDKTSGNSQRILEHPAPSNRHHDHYRLCHPNNSRSRIQRSTFRELKTCLNQWTPDDVPGIHCSSRIDPTPYTLSRCLIAGKESTTNMEVILVHEHKRNASAESHCLKVALFDIENQKFILRTAHPSHTAENPPAHAPGWSVDCSTILATKNFFTELKEIINSI